MNFKELLPQYLDIKKEIKELEDKIENLQKKDKTVDIVQGSSVVFPYTQKNFKIETIDKKTKETLQYYYFMLQSRYDRLLEMKTQIEEFIDNIPTSRLRRIFTYRYIEQYSWIKIATLIGNGATEDSVRKEHDRFFQKKGKIY